MGIEVTASLQNGFADLQTPSRACKMASRIYKPISRPCKVGSRFYKPISRPREPLSRFRKAILRWCRVILIVCWPNNATGKAR